MNDDVDDVDDGCLWILLLFFSGVGQKHRHDVSFATLICTIYEYRYNTNNSNAQPIMPSTLFYTKLLKIELNKLKQQK